MASEHTPTDDVENNASLRRLKILYVVPGTKIYAGIERVVDEIAGQLADDYASRFDLDVLYLSHFENHEIGARSYNKIQAEPTTRTELLRTAREVVGRADYDLVVVPQIEPTVIFWFACIGLPSKFVLHLHGNPKRERSHAKAKILFYLMKTLVLPRLAGVFGTSPRQLESFRDMFPSNVPLVWAPNPVRRFHMKTDGVSPKRESVTFVSVARFDYQKGQDLLTLAFAKLYERRKNVRLRIVGYGADEPQLRDTIARLGVGEVVSLEYYPNDPQLPLATSDVYVCSSRWEGWSLAICEALRFGLPVVSTDCEFGPSDILTDRRLGRLVPLPETTEAVDGLVEAMLYYCDNLHSEQQNAEFRKQYVERFSVEQVVHVHADALSRFAQRIASVPTPSRMDVQPASPQESDGSVGDASAAPPRARL
jgi:glycosyltransferase involved in cell wall biosynthesis